MASETGTAEDAPIYGVSAEFPSPAALLASVRALLPQGLGEIETHTPIPVPGLSEALGRTGSLTLYGALASAFGFVATFGMCVYATAYSYVFDIGGRPLVSWPAFVVPSLSAAMLAGALATLLGLLITNRLPRLNHPAFNIPNITRASQDRYFLVITPPLGGTLDLGAIGRAMEALEDRPLAVAEVPR